MRWLLPPIPFYRWHMKKLNNLSKVTQKMLGQIINSKSYYYSGWETWPQSLWLPLQGLCPFHLNLGAHDCFSILRTDTMWPLRIGRKSQAALSCLLKYQATSCLITLRPPGWRGPHSGSDQEPQQPFDNTCQRARLRSSLRCLSW